MQNALEVLFLIKLGVPYTHFAFSTCLYISSVENTNRDSLRDFPASRDGIYSFFKNLYVLQKEKFHFIHLRGVKHLFEIKLLGIKRFLDLRIIGQIAKPFDVTFIEQLHKAKIYFIS